jgi:glycolate oxidase FAD binding subunit
MTSAPVKILPSRLADIVGASNLLTDPARIAAFEVDGMCPSAAARPGSAEEVVGLVRLAVADKLAVIATGARTKIGFGMPPERYDLAIDMTRLDRVIAYDPGDLTLSVEAGLPLAKLAPVLAGHKQFLPLAVPFIDRATIGGTLASGVDTPLRNFYGTPRDYVLGMEFVTGEGVLAKSGGRVVKNVTGYDLHKLMIGSFGTLGVITRANFKTFPLPGLSRGFLASFSEADGALEMRRRVAESPLRPVTFEILDPQMAQIFPRMAPPGQLSLPAPGRWFSRSQWCVAIGFEGQEKVIERYTSELKAIADAAGATASHVLDDETRPTVWGWLRESVPMMLEASPATTILRISVLPAQLRDIFRKTQQIAQANELPVALLARGVGVCYCAFLPPRRDLESVQRLAKASKALFEAAEQAGGRAVIERCPLELKRALSVWGEPREDFPLMQRVKKVFDPHRLLSRGRFVGGL